MINCKTFCFLIFKKCLAQFFILNFKPRFYFPYFLFRIIAQGIIHVINVFVQFHAVEGKYTRAGISNTRPAGRMWPALRVFAACVIIKIPFIIFKTTVLLGTRVLFCTSVTRGDTFAYLCGLRALFSSKCGPVYI